MNIANQFDMEKLEWCATRWWKNFADMFIRFDMIHERDRHTDGQTPHDGIGRAYALCLSTLLLLSHSLLRCPLCPVFSAVKQIS